MRFDSYWSETPAAFNEDDLPLPEDGQTEALISEVSVKAESWAKDATNNPNGDCLKVKLNFGTKWRPVTQSIPLHWQNSISELCRGAAVPAPSRGVDWDEQSLVGAIVGVEVARAVSSRGTEYVRVKYLEPPKREAPAAPAPAPAPATRPTAAKRRDPAPPAGGSDDVPF